MPLVFVYGTLREGESNFGYMQRARRVASRAWIDGQLIDTGEGYPGLIREDVQTQKGQARVLGEVYEVSRGHLAWLDRLERYFGPGHPDNVYERIETTVDTESETWTAWTYLYLPTADGSIRFSDWKEYQHRTSTMN